MKNNDFMLFPMCVIKERSNSISHCNTRVVLIRLCGHLNATSSYIPASVFAIVLLPLLLFKFSKRLLQFLNAGFNWAKGFLGCDGSARSEG